MRVLGLQGRLPQKRPWHNIACPIPLGPALPVSSLLCAPVMRNLGVEAFRETGRFRARV